METTVLAGALLVLAGVFVVVGLLALTERLPRNGFVGIQTDAVKQDDARWRAGHRAAAPLLLAAAGPPLLLAGALLVAPPAAAADWFIVYAVVGVITGGLVAVAVRQADRVAIDLDET